MENLDKKKFVAQFDKLISPDDHYWCEPLKLNPLQLVQILPLAESIDGLPDLEADIQQAVEYVREMARKMDVAVR